MKHLSIIITVSFFCTVCYSQGNKSVINIDSMAIWEVRKISHPLNLSEDQTKYMLVLTTFHLHELDNIRKAIPTDHSLINAITDSKKRLKEGVEQVLSSDQFAIYLEIQEIYRKDFIQSQDQRKIKVKTIDAD